MARINVDPSKTQDSVPPGEYEVMIADVEERKPKKDPKASADEAKSPYLNVTLKVIAGEYEGRTIFDMLSLSPKSQFKLNAFTKALGYAPGEQEVDTDDWKNKILIVAAKDLEEFGGELRFRPKRYIQHPTVTEQIKAELEGNTGAAPAAPVAAAPVVATPAKVKVTLPGRRVTV